MLYGASRQHMDGVVNCMAPVSGVSGLGRHIGKEKKKLRQKKKRHFWWQIGRLLFPLNFHYLHLILAGALLPWVLMEPRVIQPVCYHPLLTTVPENYS